MNFNDFVKLLNDRVLIGDGAMGTMLYEHGVFLNQCFDELNLTNPKLIKQIHLEYIKAGCDFIETNTFAANEIKLAKYGLDRQLEAINKQGVEIARSAAAEHGVYVAGSIGPLGVEIAVDDAEANEKFVNVYERQIAALNEAQVDFLLLETFANPRELMLAVKAAAKVCDLPIVAHISPNQQLSTKYGDNLGDVIEKISSYENVAAVGLNCGVGPASMLESLDIIRPRTSKAISIMPNAGMPRDVDGRRIYMSTPEYMAEFAKRFYEKDVRIIGGCCGSRPEHIKEMSRAVKSLDKAFHYRTVSVAIESVEEKNLGAEPKSLSEKSKLGHKLSTGQKIYSIEIMPPRGTDIASVVEKARQCSQYGIDAVNIPDGPRASSRLSPLVTAISITQQVDIEIVLHVCCRDRNIISMQSDMLGAHVMGLKNVLLITGDPPKLGEFPDATAVFDLDSVALTNIVSRLNRGLDIAGNVLAEPLALTVAVGVNPVANDFEREIERFKQKVDAGAEYCITQPVFDVASLERFLNAIEGYRIPVVAGIWPFASYKNAEFMANEVPGVVVPSELLERMSKAKTKEQGRKEGVMIAREMLERIDSMVAGYTVSAPFGNVGTALAVLGKMEV